ncbi:putative ATP-dependent RNA helicase BoYb isoform X2 [Drosophila guanche]|uniref:RNA helicase n=1 Tax=Drosophila guanche TaxID=7266 RepID=A0A3B0K5K6_DROGU|nr:putative ATP-dependent RNA helicase BoYb isoform X1 [Drosophila guanche]XP_034139940.1 putative ATP-dependent RNA helicase BoYb isoform X2 [Drosophila guanche]SPP89507.1 blast:Putative ATP-dependent RNA helicase BoYb [Drosophila guanche]
MSDDKNNNLLKLENFVQPLMGANCSEYAVAHANVNVTPFRTFAEVSMLPDIVHRMRKLGLNRLQRLQSYAWPHILNGPGHGVLIVSAPRSGRTMGYVPPICHAASTTLAANRQKREMADDLLNISHGIGPIVLILVPDVARMEQVAALCRALMPQDETLEDLSTIRVTKVLTVPSECTVTLMGAWISEIGILVATPARFANACRQGEGLLKLNQLQIVAFDDVELMQQEELKLAQQYIPSMTAKHSRPIRKGSQHYPRPQVLMVCQHLTPSLFAQMRRFNQYPCLIFGDLLEAALYGGMRLLVNMVGPKDKVAAIVNMLRQRPPEDYRTIIFCDKDVEMAQLGVALAEYGYQCLAYYQTMDMEQLDKVCSWTCDSRGVIFVCTDNCPELRIRNAHTIIHYNMSSSWSRFKKRFMFLSDNVANALEPSKAPAPPTATAKDQRILDSLALLDETNARQLPRLVDFMLLRNKVDPKIVEMAARIRKQLNMTKTIAKPMCGEILSHGDCWNTRCEDRHYLHESDRRSSAVPCEGDIKVNVVHVHSPGHYSVIAFEHKPMEGKWYSLNPDRNLPALMNIRLSGDKAKPLPRYWPPRHQAVCLWKPEPGAVAGYVYERVRVLSVPPIENENVYQSSIMVLVQAMDHNTRRFETKCKSLHICPDEYVNEPPLSIDLRLLGMINHMGDRYYARVDANTVENWLDNAPKDHFVQAKVVFSTSHTIFVSCMASMVYLKSLKTFNLHLNLFRAQIEAKMSKRCAATKAKILKFFEELIKLDDPTIPQEPPEQEQEHAQEQEQVANGHKDQHIVEDMGKCSPSEQDVWPQAGLEFVLEAQRLKMDLEETNGMLEPKQSQRPAVPVDQEQDQDQEQEQEQPEESEASDLKVVPVKDFYDCFMRCEALDRIEDMQTATRSTASNNRHQMLTEAPTVQPSKESKKKSQQEINKKSNGKQLSTNTGITASNAALILQSGSRPNVKYFQTPQALHLQVTMVDEKMSYKTCVQHGTCIYFKAIPADGPVDGSGASTCNFSSVHEFFVNTRMILKGIQHAMRGRTVYIELQKVKPGYHPTQFVHLKFFQPNYDKIAMEEKWHLREKNFLKQLMKDHGWGVLKHSACAESSEEPVSESESEDGVERPEDYRKIHMT